MYNIPIKLSFFVSYDYKFLYDTLPIVYNYVDLIYLAIDKNYLTWNGKTFSIPNSFFKWVKNYDNLNKIRYIKDNFYNPELNPRENEFVQRKKVYKLIGLNCWQIHVEPDEYFINFESFVNYIKQLNPNIPVAIGVNFITIFKRKENSFFLIQEKDKQYVDVITIATNSPLTHGRGMNKYKIKRTPFFILHDSWGRSEDDIWLKITNWGHSKDFNLQSYFNLWKSIDEYNYKFIHNFHPFANNFWMNLKIIEAESISVLLELLPNYFDLKFSKFNIWKLNSNIYRLYKFIIIHPKNYFTRGLRFILKKILKFISNE